MISKNDGLPEQLCSNCIYKLGIAYHFKQTSESADIRLRQYLGLTLQKKTMSVAIMTDPVPTQTIIRKCKCQLAESKKSSTAYKRKPETEKQKRGPKPKPKQVHSCYQCDKEFRCQAQLDMHVRTHTGDRPFGCMYCSRRFTQKHNLTIHLRIHTGEKPFQCEICSKRFSAQGNLHTHLKVHTGQRDHTCTICNKSFITSSELTRHMCKHRGVKDYKCDICGAAFVQARDLKLHKLKKHEVALNDDAEKNTVPNNQIDVIGIDVGKDPISKEVERSSIEDKLVNEEKSELDHKNSTKCVQWSLEKQSFTVAEPPLEVHPFSFRSPKDAIDPHSSGLSEIKGTKDVFNQDSYNHSCRICGEQFDFITALAHHYLHSHKDYEPVHLRGYNFSS
ncbi:zinc finger protein 182 isoform X2 [Plutella xylostella]|uniref:zinc finger protein 182 isoform X2 n=1 Tax=Plutella xylostella TaxID=51655 RepID=UPI002032ABD2|nr:zinc finger protein 182 isoform X2 [Plutella xylostella]